MRPTVLLIENKQLYQPLILISREDLASKMNRRIQIHGIIRQNLRLNPDSKLTPLLNSIWNQIQQTVRNAQDYCRIETVSSNNSLIT